LSHHWIAIALSLVALLLAVWATNLLASVLGIIATLAYAEHLIRDARAGL
jgi:hypothetical protein